MTNRLGESSDYLSTGGDSVGCLRPLLTVVLIIFMLGFGLVGLCSTLGSTAEDHFFVIAGFLGVVGMLVLLRLLWRRKR